jgi:hypothetical protein
VKINLFRRCFELALVSFSELSQVVRERERERDLDLKVAANTLRMKSQSASKAQTCSTLVDTVKVA